MLRILIVANYNPGHFSPFVIEQMESLRKIGVEIDTYGIVGKGLLGYLGNIVGIRKKIREFHPDLIHAHYGLSGLCANLQREVPVVTTYHGSDIHSGGWILKLSQISMRLSAYNIFVSKKLMEMANYKRENACVLPCGVNLETIKSIPRDEARRMLGLGGGKFVLFSSRFRNEVKNYPLAKAAMELVPEATLIELTGYDRQQVGWLMNACDVQLTTSWRESGPLVVKEAMACGTPIVSVDVGDVKEVVGNTTGCYMTSYDEEDVASKIRMALAFEGKTNGRKRIEVLGLDNRIIAQKLLTLYKQLAA